MLSPNKRIVLLPQDKEIISLTGMTEEQYRFFCRQAILHSKIRPGEPVAFDPFGIVITLVIGIALSYAATLLAPTPQQDKPKQQRNVGGQDIVNGERFSPTSGFDSVQNVVEIGSVVALVYANRQQIDGIWYGGVRVNTNLLWSQLYSVGGGQLLRSIFLVGEGVIPQPDPTQFALGNNLLANYDLAVDDTSRISLYYADGSRESNRIQPSDHIAGRLPSSDLGNASNSGGRDVFQARTDGANWASDFVYTTVPSNQTQFGVYGFIGNNMPFRVSPRIQPTENFDNQPQKPDPQGKSDREKDVWRYQGRSGIYAVNGVNVANPDYSVLGVGDTVTYGIFKDSDANGVFQFAISGADGFTYVKDIASAIASRQNSFDDQIQIGDKYLIGTAQGVCVSTTIRPFNSEMSNLPIGLGQSVSYVFRITQPGAVHTYPIADLNPSLQSDGRPFYAPDINATKQSHIMRMAEGFFTTERAGRFVEIGLRSSVSLRLNGATNYRDIAKGNATRTLTRIDADRVDDNIVFTSGTYTSPETRYSFFRISYKSTDAQAFTTIPEIFAVRSMMDSAVYNYLRFDFGSVNTWEVKLTPVSGFEARNSSLSINALDYKRNNRVTISSVGVQITFTGDINVLRSASNFAVPVLTTIDGRFLSDNNGTGLLFDDFADGRGYFGDAFARMAEYFMFNEITATTTQPEHNIVYINTQTSNATEPDYSNLAMVGLNIRSSREISQLQQFSIYCNQGINSINLFPDVLLDLLTNDRYGTGNILNVDQIDKQSFADAAAWCEERRYFFDGTIEDLINIRSWASNVASNYLLDLVIRNGRFALQPVCEFDERVVITGLYTSGNILEDSFQMSYSDEQNRIPPRISVRWRDERPDNNGGLFSVIRQVTVRESIAEQNAPLEQLDISSYATSEKQAIDLAKYTCRLRRLVTHTVSFTTTPTQATLDIGAVFKLGMESLSYEQPQNGAIASDGTVTSWPPLADGSYDVLIWDGTTDQVLPTTIQIANGKTNTTSAVFCIRNTISQTQTYKTQSLSFNEEGNIDVEATSYPVDADGYSLLSQGWDDPANWVIEGSVY